MHALARVNAVCVCERETERDRERETERESRAILGGSNYVSLDISRLRGLSRLQCGCSAIARCITKHVHSHTESIMLHK